jgi:hypothetical protein
MLPRLSFKAVSHEPTIRRRLRQKTAAGDAAGFQAAIAWTVPTSQENLVSWQDKKA